MDFKIIEIKEKEIWENFLWGVKEKTFLNSFQWGFFNEMLGNKVWRFGVRKNSDLWAVFLVVGILAKRGRFIFLPHGPIIPEFLKSERKKILEVILEKLKEIGKKEKFDFIRLCPLWPEEKETNILFEKLGFRDAPLHLHPEITWELDLEKDEQKLLSGMRKTTRYLIKQALKTRGLSVQSSERLEDLKVFYELYSKTAKRQKFTPFSYDYLEKQFLSFLPSREILIVLVKYNKEILAGGIFVFWQKIIFYHHGASLPSKIPAVYLLIWEAIKKAKERKCHTFNFWGITLKKNHPWSGLSFFKQGFGGRLKKYIKTKDFILRKRYWLNFLIEKARKIKRRL
ncbi:MAG: lipid II:glycine glycyltransferase FemX [Minisyncoccales bacterium]